MPLRLQLADFGDQGVGVRVRGRRVAFTGPEEDQAAALVSDLKQRLLDHYAACPDFILPESRRNEILSEVQGRIRGVRTEGSQNRLNEVFDAGESSDADIQEDIEFALIQMKAETLNKINEALARLTPQHRAVVQRLVQDPQLLRGVREGERLCTLRFLRLAALGDVDQLVAPGGIAAPLDGVGVQDDRNRVAAIVAQLLLGLPQTFERFELNRFQPAPAGERRR